MHVFDLHCDTIARLYAGEHLDSLSDGHISLEKLRRGGTTCQCFAVFVPWNPQGPQRPWMPDTPEAYFEGACAAWQRELERSAASLAPARTAAEVLENQAAGKVGGMLTVEDCVALNGHIERLDDWHQKGVRMAALTWNYENSLGWPNSPDPAAHGRGLKPFGMEAVARMNELGIAVDVSHLSEGGFWDVARLSRKPFAASHSCARALCDVPRNLTDAQLRAIGDAGGVVGVNYYARFLRPEAVGKGETTEIDDVLRHLRHMANVAGVEALALGSDYDGMDSRLAWGDAGGQQALAEALERVFTPAQAEQICWKNALRFFRDVIGA